MAAKTPLLMALLIRLENELQFLPFKHDDVAVYNNRNISVWLFSYGFW